MLVNINISNNLKFNIIKKKNFLFLVIFNNSIFMKYVISRHSVINVLKDLNLVIVNTKFLNEFALLSNTITLINKSVTSYFSKKITFSGKGYKIRKFYKPLELKFNKFIVFYFNRSHLNIIYFFDTIIKKLKKSKILICNINYKNLQLMSKLILNVRNHNIFTSKGLRTSRQLIYKKIGKKSS